MVENPLHELLRRIADSAEDSLFITRDEAMIAGGALNDHQQQPVAWRIQNSFGDWWYRAAAPDLEKYPHWKSLYAAPALKKLERNPP